MAANATAVVAGRQFWVWEKAYNSSNAMPADTVVYGASFTGYTLLGYTSGGLGMNWNLQRGSIPVDQEFDPVLRPVQSRNLTLDSNLAEFTPANMLLATGQGAIASVAAGAGTRGHDELTITSNVVDTYMTVIYDIAQQNGEAIRIAAWRALPTGSPNPRFEPTNAALTAFQVSALPDTSTSPARIASIRLVTPAV
jgi:hypothetical protein